MAPLMSEFLNQWGLLSKERFCILSPHLTCQELSNEKWQYVSKHEKGPDLNVYTQAI